jgi:hypothetical protein
MARSITLAGDAVSTQAFTMHADPAPVSRIVARIHVKRADEPGFALPVTPPVRTAEVAILCQTWLRALWDCATALTATLA